MNFKEHYQLLNEGILSTEYKISIFFPQERFDNLKYGMSEEDWKKKIKSIKQDTVFRIGSILNKILFDGSRGVVSDGRMSISVDLETLNDTQRRLVLYAVGVKFSERGNEYLHAADRLFKNSLFTMFKASQSHLRLCNFYFWILIYILTFLHWFHLFRHIGIFFHLVFNCLV
jgi:hypothetical protein